MSRGCDPSDDKLVPHLYRPRPACTCQLEDPPPLEDPPDDPPGDE
jgi:hypothetical protein